MESIPSTTYVTAVETIKTAILQGQYEAAKGVNRIQLAVYFSIGKYISLHTRKGVWGTGALETISQTLRKELPGLRGFSATQLKEMRLFYEAWMILDPNSSVMTDELNANSATAIAELQDYKIDIYHAIKIPETKDFPLCKAFLLENGGTKIGLPGNHFYVDKSILEAIAKYAKRESYELVWKETTNELFLFVTKDKDDLENVIMGFCFDSTAIEPPMEKYKTVVYKLNKFYPHDENPNEFCFDLDNFVDYNV